MSAFFGIEAQGSEKLIKNGALCVNEDDETESDLLEIFRTIRAEDVIFLKSFSPQTGMRVQAIGVVLPNSAREHNDELCMPVEWCWRGESHIDVTGETYNHCGDRFYEECDIWMQKQIEDLLPDKFKLAEEW